MDPSTSIEAIVRLDRLRTEADAQLLTCYFRNPYSQFLWLFHRSGDFKYDCQMHGPLTFTEHFERVRIDTKFREGPFSYFLEPPLEWKRNSLTARPFADREEVKQAIRICFTPRAKDLKSDRGSIDEAEVVIFLNFRKVRSKSELKKEMTSRVDELDVLRLLLLDLSRQPVLEPEKAWRLRSLVLRTQMQIGEVLGSRAQEQCQQLYNDIVERAFEHFKPRYGNAVLCSLSEVDANHRARSLAKKIHGKQVTRKPVKRKLGKHVQSVGIVDYVARTGQVYYVSDVAAYRTMPADWEARPEYEECVLSTRSELACPLIVQDRVVGVLNLEADRPHAYGPGEVLEVVQFAAVAALAVRQASLWRDIQLATAQQQGMHSLRDESDVFNRIVDTVTQLGYIASVWDYERPTQQWYQPSKTRPGDRAAPPRNDKGFTAWVREHGRPLLLADLHVAGIRTLFNYQLAAEVDRSLLFVRWVKPEANDGPFPSGIHPDMVRHTKADAALLSYFVFPVFASTAPTRKGLPPVRAVLWARCHRSARSLLDDDAWCLSLICRNATQALELLAARRE